MPTGSQGNIKYGVLRGIPVAIKSCKHDTTCLILEANVLQRIHKECPNVSSFFPKFIEFTSDGDLVMTRVLNGKNLTHLTHELKNTNKHASKIILNLCFIVLCVLESVRIETGIVHNDLHSCNVMVIPSSVRIVSFTINETTYSYNTYGYCPIIIDFGYACGISGVVGSLQNSDLGYTVEEQDCLADARLLLYSSAKGFNKVTNTIIKFIFSSLNLTNEGWFSPEVCINVYDELYTIAEKEPIKSMDAILTIIVNLMGNLHDESCIKICCDDCYFAEELIDVYFTDESEEDTINHLKSCNCTDAIRDAFARIYDKRVTNTLLMESAIAFKPVIVHTLAQNRTAKRILYDTLSVKTSLDVINEYNRLLRLVRYGKICHFECGVSDECN